MRRTPARLASGDILSYLPDHNMADPPVEETADPKDPEEHRPRNPRAR